MTAGNEYRDELSPQHSVGSQAPQETPGLTNSSGPRFRAGGVGALLLQPADVGHVVPRESRQHVIVSMVALAAGKLAWRVQQARAPLQSPPPHSRQVLKAFGMV